MTCFLMCCFLFNVQAAVKAQHQTVSLKLKQASVAEAIRQLKAQTDLDFFFSHKQVDADRKVSVNLQNVPLEEALKELLGEGYEFEYLDNMVVINPAVKQLPVVPQEVLTLKGTVTDESGAPLPGVAVLIKGTTVGVATDVDGNFTLSIPKQEKLVLVFSYMGMNTKEVTYNGQEQLNVVLVKALKLINEVVVTGYSTRKINELTGSMQVFKGEDLTKWTTGGGNIMNALRGHTTGLQITGSSGAPGSDGTPLLRGKGTIYTDSQLGSNPTAPLIVIDGVVTDYTSLGEVVSASDIEEITVLKDAASTAIYGSRAATGVIVVTTKKGLKDKMTVSLNIKTGINVPNFNGLEYMNSQELLEFGQMTLRNWWNGNENLQAAYPNREQFLQDTLGTLQKNFDLTKTTDWKDLVYRTGISEDVALSIRGGGENMRYYFSYNYYGEEGTLKTYDLKRHLFKTRLDFDITKFLTVGVNLNGTISKNTSLATIDISDTHPWLTPYNEDGTLKYNIEYWDSFTMEPEPMENPLQDMKYNNTINLNNHLFGSFYGALKPFSWMSFTSTNTLTLQNTNSNSYEDSRTYSGNNASNDYSNGTLSVSDTRSWTFLTSNILRLQHRFGKHNLSGLIGQEYYERHSRGSAVSVYDQNIPGERNIGGFSKQGTPNDDSYAPSGSETESGSFSVFAEVNYNYANKYMAALSFRTDASTNFGKDNRYGTFYSVSASWLVSNEKFMQKQNVFSNLKLRLSYGTSGKEAGKDYLNYTLYKTGNTTFDYYQNHPIYQSSYAATINQIGNDQLTWETAHNFNIGLNMGFLSNRIALNADCYVRRNSDLIMEVNMPAAYGIGKQYRNVGELKNTGIEISLNTHNIKGDDFNWYTDFTFSHNKNKITKLYEGKMQSGTLIKGPTVYEGDNIDVLKKIKVVGIDPETGRAQYQRINEDGSIEIVNTLQEVTSSNGELSYVDIGSSRAPYYGGFSNRFTYKNWELYVHTSYSFGNKVYDALKTSYTGRGWLSHNLYKMPSKWTIWQQPGDKADLPIANADPAFRQDLGTSTSFGYVNGSYWRIQNIRLAYNFPKKWMNAIGFQEIGLSFTCDNVYTFTSKDFAGRDPETPDGWAAPRRFIFGLNVGF